MHHNNWTEHLATLRATFCQLSIRGANFKLRVLVLLNEHTQHSNLQSAIEMQTWVGYSETTSSIAEMLPFVGIDTVYHLEDCQVPS